MKRKSKFSFDPKLLESCVYEIESKNDVDVDEGINDTTSEGDFHKTLLTETSSSSSSSSDADAGAGACLELYQAYRDHFYEIPGFSMERYRKFQETVKLIYNHNTNQDLSYSITLNRFSDQLNSPVVPVDDAGDDDDGAYDKQEGIWEEKLQLRSRRNRLLLRHDDDDDDDGGGDEDGEGDDEEQDDDGEPLQSRSRTELDKKNENMEEEWKMFSGSILYKKHKYRYKTKIDTTKVKTATGVAPPLLTWHHYVSDQPFNVVDLPTKGIGVEMDLKSTNRFRSSTKQQPQGNTTDDNEQQDTLFSTSLNWATKNNPDQVPLVHDVFDQGDCGSCWAYAATGSLETIIARRAARDHYIRYLTKQEVGLQQQQQQSEPTTATNLTTVVANWTVPPRPTTLNYRHAKRKARHVERKTFQKSRLSIQELIDCDTAADQGCIGGNPLLAFYYIKKYGLVPWEEYPYTGTKDQCQLDNITKPIVTVTSWGSIPKDHEDMIALVVRYIGPVAVAVNAGAPTFIGYEGGIYDNPNCSQKANHALLIVGYGEEEIPDGDSSPQIARYWIARNSWGLDWGENGYIRIKRGPGGRKTKGICGLARSPSVALRGKYHPNGKILVDDIELDDPTKQQNLDYSPHVAPSLPDNNNDAGPSPIDSGFCHFAFQEDSIAQLECIELSQ